MADIVMQVPPALLQIITYEPTVIVDQEAAITDIFPGNLEHGQKGKALLKNIDPEGASITIDGVLQEIVDATDPRFIEFLADINHLGGLGEYQVSIGLPYAVITQGTLKTGLFGSSIPQRNINVGTLDGIDQVTFTGNLNPMGGGSYHPDSPLRGVGYAWSGAYGDVPISSSVLPAGNYDFWTRDTTVGAWLTIKFGDTQQDPQYMRYIMSGRAGGTVQWAFGYYVSDYKPVLYIKWGAGAGDWDEYKFTKSFIGRMLSGLEDSNHWSDPHFGFDNANNKVYIGMHGYQEEFTLANDPMTTVDSITLFGNNDQSGRTVQGYVAEVFYADGLIFGNETTYDRTDTELYGVWSEVINEYLTGSGPANYTVSAKTDNNLFIYGRAHSSSQSYTQCYSYNLDPGTPANSLFEGNQTTAREATAGGGTFSDCFFVAGCPQNAETTYSDLMYQWNGASWSAGGSAVAGRRDHGVVGLVGAAMMTGGNDGLKMDETEEYDGTSWSAGNLLVAAADYFGITGSPQDAILSSAYGTERYNGTIWSTETQPGTLHPRPGAFGSAISAVITGGGYYEGDDEGFSWYDDVFSWNDTTWTVEQNMPEVCGSNTGTGHSGLGYIAGGSASRQGSRQNIYQFASPNYPMRPYPRST